MSTDDQTNPRGVQRSRPETVDALASTVLSVLRERQSTSSEGLRQFVVDHLLRAVLGKAGFAPDALLLELRGYRLTLDTIIDHYVPTVARILGDKWQDDEINFADVTIGIMRLQALLAEASAADQANLTRSEHFIHAVVLVPQGEQHFLGASVLSGQLRRLGCEVDMSFDEDMGTLSARLMQNMPDMVLITCARRETLESIANTVQTIRGVASTCPLLVLGGALEMKKEDIKARTGVDLVTKRAEEAMATCIQRNDHLGRP